MKIEYEDEDLKELIETGQNKKYKKIAKNKVLMGGLLKVYRILDQAPHVSLLNQFSFLKVTTQHPYRKLLVNKA